MNRKVIFLALLLFAFCSRGYSEPRRVLIEYCTGTWCGWCPCGHQVIEDQVLPQYPNTVCIAYHGALNDPWREFEGAETRNLLGFTAYPTAVVDRTNDPNNPVSSYQTWFGKVQSRYSTSANTRIDLAMTYKAYNPSSRELVFTLSATALENLTGQFKVQFVLIENNVVYPQFFGSGCGTYGYHNDYVHKHIARSVLNGNTGENLNVTPWAVNQVLSRSFSKILDTAWVPENLELIAIVFKDSSSLFYANVEQAIKIPVTQPLGVINQNTIPEKYLLSQNYPNPFNPTTNVKFALPEPGNVSLKVYDITGREVMDFINGYFEAGTYNAEINMSELTSGVYFYTISAGSFTETKKMMLVK
jgi:hypothetical protein